jgi:hypothetical protein
MAFTGSATVTQISDRKCLITGLSLAAGATGTISLAAGAGAVLLPAGFQPKPYNNGAPGSAAGITLQESIQCTTNPNSAVATAIPVEVVKTGNDNVDFLLSLTNNHGSIASPNLEIWVEWH